MALHDVANLVLDKTVRTAAEAGHLDEMNLIALFGCPLRCLQNAVHIRPLLHEISLWLTVVCFVVVLAG